MTQVGRPTRLRSITLTALAAGGVFLPVAALAVGSLGWLPGSSAAEAIDQATSDNRAATAAYGASGILPQAGDLDPVLLERLTSPDPVADLAVSIPPGVLHIPPAALAAYHRAAEALALQQPDCRLDWTLLAGLGRVISDHGSGSLDDTGNSTKPILGPRLDGSPGLASIPDTDGGRIDSDSEWDHASGPMQIVPGAWRRVGGDSDGDGFGSPHNVFDAALGAGRYVCEDGVDLAEVTAQARAVFRYQRSDVFVRAVMAWTLAYGPRVAPPEAPAVALPSVRQIAPPSAPPPPTGSLPQGTPQAPASALSPTHPPLSPSGPPRPSSEPPATSGKPLPDSSSSPEPPESAPTEPPGSTPPGSTPPGSAPPGSAPPGSTPPGSAPPGSAPPPGPSGSPGTSVPPSDPSSTAPTPESPAP